MNLDLDAYDKLSARKTVKKTDWRTFSHEGNKIRLLISNIGNDAYRIAQERLIEQLRSNMFNLTEISTIEETQLAKQLRIVAYHLVEDWEGLVDKKTQLEIPFTHENLATVLIYSGDLGIRMHAFILENATDLQNILSREISLAVGKPYSFIDSIEKGSETQNTTKSDND